MVNKEARMLERTTYVCDRCGDKFECKEDELPHRWFGEKGMRGNDPSKNYREFCFECTDAFKAWMLAPGKAAQKK